MESRAEPTWALGLTLHARAPTCSALRSRPPAHACRPGVKVFCVVHEAGSFVIAFPRAYHAGFSCGFSVGEAANFGLGEGVARGRGPSYAAAAFQRRGGWGRLPYKCSALLLGQGVPAGLRPARVGAHHTLAEQPC